MAQHQALRRHAAEGEAVNESAFDFCYVEHGSGVVGEIVGGAVQRRPPGAPEAAIDPEPLGEPATLRHQVLPSRPRPAISSNGVPSSVAIQASSSRPFGDCA
jgi:hypothetical protein